MNGLAMPILEVGKTKLGDTAIYPMGAKEPMCILIGEDRDRAVFIARAVNMHSELVEMCKLALELLNYSPRHSVIMSMRKAIAKAEGMR